MVYRRKMTASRHYLAKSFINLRLLQTGNF